MNKKIISAVLAFALLTSVSAYAVPLDLWSSDERVERLYTIDNATSEFDIVQKIINYIGIATKEDISGNDDVNSTVLLSALAKIVGFKYGDDVQAVQVFADLKEAGYFYDDAVLATMTFRNVLYAAARITGWAEEGDDDVRVYIIAKRVGLLRNITYNAERKLTKSEAAQMLYNIISVNTRVRSTYGSTSYKKENNTPIIESVYGITLKKGVVTAVASESIYDTTNLDDDEIKIDNKLYNFNSTESSAGLLGRMTAYFIDTDKNYVIFAEPTSDNNEYTINFGEKPDFYSDCIKISTESEKINLAINLYAKVIYNGMPVGTYNAELIDKYFNDCTSVTAIDNDDDNSYDIIYIRKWVSYPVLFNVSSEGIITFDHKLKFEGKGYIDVTPDDDNIHVTVLKNGVRTDFMSIHAGDLVSVSASANEIGDKYIIIETNYTIVNGTLDAIGYSDETYYVINNTEYNVSKDYLDAQKNASDVIAPTIGNSYSFFVDVTGRIINANVDTENELGYLVKMSLKGQIDPECNIKIFTQMGNMIIVPVDEKVQYYDCNNFTGTKLSKNEFANKVKERGTDYRSLIKYKLNKDGELFKIWFPLDNTSAQSTYDFGKTGYELTLDAHIAKNQQSYYGLVSNYQYRVANSVPIFCVPEELDDFDGYYLMKNINFNGVSTTIPSEMDFYCVDEFNIVSAIVITEEPRFDNYSDIVIVDRIGRCINQDGDTAYQIFGNVNGQEKTYTAVDDVTSTPQNGWYSGINISNLEFGDIIQMYKIDDDIKKFRVLYRTSDPGKDRLQYAGGTSTRTGTDGQLWVLHGNFVDRKLDAIRIRQNISGIETIKPYFMNSNGNIGTIIIDTQHENILKSTSSELTAGDRILAHGKWGFIENIFIIR